MGDNFGLNGNNDNNNNNQEKDEKKINKAKLRKAKNKSKGKRPSKKKYLKINLEKAKKVVNVDRIDTQCCAEGHFDTELPEELYEYITQEEYEEVITTLNNKLKSIPTLRYGYFPCIPWSLVCFVLLV